MIFGKKKDRVEQRDRIISYKRVFSGAEGKEVLFDILNRCHVLSTHKGDPFSEGRRSVALDILTNCNINLAEFDKIVAGEGMTE